jgi:hypothetical protein
MWVPRTVIGSPGERSAAIGLRKRIPRRLNPKGGRDLPPSDRIGKEWIGAAMRAVWNVFPKSASIEALLAIRSGQSRFERYVDS